MSSIRYREYSIPRIFDFERKFEFDTLPIKIELATIPTTIEVDSIPTLIKFGTIPPNETYHLQIIEIRLMIEIPHSR